MLTVLALLAATPAIQASSVPAGSPERRAILDALRPPIERAFRVPVEFVPSQVCTLDGWALVAADPRRRGGGALPWRNAMDAAAHENGGVEVTAVLRRVAGRWTVVEHALGATDVWYEGMGPKGLDRGCA